MAKTGSREGEAERRLLKQEFRLLVLLGAVVAAGAVFVAATGVFLLAFAGVLVAVVLRDPSRWLSKHLPLSDGWALALVVAILLGLLAALGWFAAPRVVEQAAAFAERLPEALDAVDRAVRERLGSSASLSIRGALPDAEWLLGVVPNIVTTTFGMLGSLLVVFVVGIYLAVRPDMYREGVVQLFSPNGRGRVRRILDEVGDVLTRWMRGQVVAMVVVGILAYASLKLLGVPLALTLALLTAIMEFVPYIGAIVAAVPVVLLASTESWNLAVYALIAYVLIQSLEGYLLIPLIQRQAIFVPPAMILLSQVLLGVLFGVVGIVLATPLTAAVAVLVRRGYVEGVLEARAGD